MWLYNILVANNVVNCGRLQDPLGHGEHIHIWFPSALLIIKTKFPNPCHALKNSVAVRFSLSLAKVLHCFNNLDVFLTLF